MKHKIKNISGKTLPTYDGTDRFIKSGEIMEVEVTEKVQYMLNNGFFENLGKVESSKRDVDKNLDNIDRVQEDFFLKDEAKEQKKAIEEYEPKPHKKKGKKRYKKQMEDD